MSISTDQVDPCYKNSKGSYHKGQGAGLCYRDQERSWSKVQVVALPPRFSQTEVYAIIVGILSVFSESHLNEEGKRVGFQKQFCFHFIALLVSR